ncbi:MAG: alpha/beta hydrolase family esterase [Myxococcales bacterium]
MSLRTLAANSSFSWVGCLPFCSLLSIGIAACSSEQQQTDAATRGGATNDHVATTAGSDAGGGSSSQSKASPNAGGVDNRSSEGKGSSPSTTSTEPESSVGGALSKSSARGGASTRSSGSAAGGSSSVGGRPSLATGGVVAKTGGASSMGGSSRSTGGASPSTNTTKPSDSGIPTSGCGKDKPAQAPGAVDVSGTNRTFIVDVPSSYDPNTPTPILFAFHGMSLTAAQFRSFDNLNSSFASTYIVVRPNALGDPTQWQSTGTQDFLFFDAMFKLLTEAYCIDTKRVFLTGHSSGGYFTNALACQRSTIVRGIAPQSGAGPIDTRKCTGSALAVMIIHGQSDPSVLPAEGAKSRDYWGKAAGCDMNSGTTSSLSPVCLEYSGCEDGHPLVYCPYDGDHNLWKDAPKTMFQFFNGL